MTDRPRSPSAVTLVQMNLVLAVCYAVLGKLCLVVYSAHDFAALIWLPAGLALAAVVLLGPQLSPGVIIGSALVPLSAGQPPLAALGIGVANASESYMAYWMLTRWAAFHPNFGRSKDVLTFLVCGAVLSPLLGALVAGLAMDLTGVVARPAAFKTMAGWWISDLGGNLVLAPLLLIWHAYFSRPRTVAKVPYGRRGLLRRSECVFVPLCLLLTSALLFLIPDLPVLHAGPFLQPYFLLPLLVWLALRFPFRWAVTLTFAVVSFALAGSVHGRGPFAYGEPLTSALLALVFTLIVSLTVMVLAALRAEQRRSDALLAIERQQLEKRVEARTAELARANGELTESRELLSLALKSSRSGYFQRDLRSGAVQWSDDMLHLFGFLPEAFGDSYDGYYALMHPDDRPRVNLAMERAVQHKELYDAEYRVRLADGSYVWVWARGRVFYGADGVAERVLGICVDITERKQVEQALQQSDRRKSEFLAMLGHELRNPLAPLVSGIALLRAGDTLQEGEAKATVAMMDRQIAQMVRLVGDLLDVARISHGKISLVKSRTSLQSLVEHAIQTSAPLFRAKNQRLTLSLRVPDATIDVDAMRMAQVLANLLNNAAKYSAHGSETILSVIPLAPSLRIVVKDHGIGLAPAMLARLFEPFAQAEHSLPQAQGGLGVGLALARRLVELHGGVLNAVSAGVGLGSEFIIDLPSAGLEWRPALPEPAPGAPVVAVARAAARARVGASGHLRRRVLVVDDNHDAAESFALLLQHWNLDVDTAHDGQGALAAVRDWRPDVVFLDIGLPDMTGYALANRIRKEAGLKEAFLVALTGYGHVDGDEMAQQAGFDLHLVKPVDPSYVLQLVQQFANA